jgi:hypothetical protein
VTKTLRSPSTRCGPDPPTASREPIPAVHSPPQHTMTTTRLTEPYLVTLQAQGGYVATLSVEARDRAHAVASAVELAGLGQGALVLRCHRLGEW